MGEGSEEKKLTHIKFIKHLRLLLWKSYLQRIRRWPIIAAETLFAAILFLLAVSAAKPVFLTPLEPTPGTPLTYNDIMMTLSPDTLVGYSPYTEPYKTIMGKVAVKLNKEFMTASSEEGLNEMLYMKSKGNVLDYHVIWVIWKEKKDNVWKYSIRSTELANLEASSNTTSFYTSLPTKANRHLRVGFLAVQMAVSEAILETTTKRPLRHNIKLKAMPISPLMMKDSVRQAMVWVLLCFTLAFIPPIMEMADLVVQETSNEYKRALVMRNVGPTCIYLGWLGYLHCTTLPILILATLAIILIFRWVWIFIAFAFFAIYVTVTAMTAFIICMFQTKSHIAAIWTALFTLLQLFVAELLVHHGFDSTTTFTIILHILLPPLGLVHGLNEFALLQIGRQGLTARRAYENQTIIIWIIMIFIYWPVLMMLQRTIGHDRAIGGQVSWRSIIFKQAEDMDKLHVIKSPLGNERDRLQEVDELVAKAISFRDVNKSIMGIPILRRLTLDVYRGEYTQLFAERIQKRMLHMLEDLITGLTLPDEGTINILGYDMAALNKSGRSIINIPNGVGFCHRMRCLVQELTIQETLLFFTQLSLWNLPDDEVEDYFLRKTPELCKECDLQDVRHMAVMNVGSYYRAQLCWAIAIIMEPRIVFVQSWQDSEKYTSVISDKIVKYRTHVTIVKLSFSTALLEHADRVFLFDRKVLVFGGTPAYMFFKYGREYRIRMTFRARGSLDNPYIEELVDRAIEMGGQVRANVGTLLILRMPTSPTNRTAAFVREITENSVKYGITSLNISLPDSEEIFKRAINDSRKQLRIPVGNDVGDNALRELSKPKEWERVKSQFLTTTLMRQTVWKYICFYIHYRFFLIITMLSAIVTGAIIGVYLSFQLKALGDAMNVAKMQHGEILTVEALSQSTTLVLRIGSTESPKSIANAYTTSVAHATKSEIMDMAYTALPYTESLTEYLMLRAIDSPQHYVYAYAYGMDVKETGDKSLQILVLYSPIHHDTAAAARSMARVYMALLRHYTDTPDAEIQVTDDPLVLDSSPIQKKTTVPPLIIHFMLIITIAHITLLPSIEHGLIRHVQSHASNFSPACYWFSLFCCDIILYWTIVFIITTVLFCVMYWVAPVHFLHRDLIVIPFMLIMYGWSCVPQAYLFSLGPSAPLNSMSFVIFNIIFGEASVISQFIHGDAFSYAERGLSLSPQYNVANAFLRMTKIFVYNSECVIFNNKKLCSSNVLHKCCKKCGVMQTCFERISYLSYTGILNEILWTVYHAILFSSLLTLWEYKVLQRLYHFVKDRWFQDTDQAAPIPVASGAFREQLNVTAKRMHIQEQTRYQIQDTFADHLLVDGLKSSGSSDGGKLTGVSFGIGKGEALAIVGMTGHGRLLMCEMLSGYRMPTSGTAIVMSQWSLHGNPHRYSREISFSCFEHSPLPPWMTVYDAMWMIAVLRGIPPKYVDEEIKNLLDALELDTQSDVKVFRLHQNERTRLNFAVAVIGAPPVLVLDEFTAYQQYSVDRAMFYILYNLRKQGHTLLVSSASVESHMPVTNRMGFLIRGRLEDVDHVDKLVARYSKVGYTVVVHLKDEVNVQSMFGQHFQHFTINDLSDVLVNVQIMDELNYAQIFGKMEDLLLENPTVYSYIISVIPLDYIYNDILDKGKVSDFVRDTVSFWPCLRYIYRKKKKVSIETLLTLQKFEKKYDICSLKELPWSVIFQR